jgi:peptidoglycan/LPS O-acetylase OafA/YrhL
MIILALQHGTPQSSRSSRLEVPEDSDNFRPDINGLRAWAVVAVVLHHFEVAGFGGGFVGVDVFFVISAS